MIFERLSRVQRGASGAAVILLIVAGSTLTGCSILRDSYETERFSVGSVKVINPGHHCKDAKELRGLDVENAELVTSRVHGLGRFVATDTAWNVLARQLATEVDGDIAVIRPCGGKHIASDDRQVEIWRTRGYKPTVKEQPPTPGVTLGAPAGSSYGMRLNDVHSCLEHAQTRIAGLSANEQARLPKLNAVEFFSSGRHFAGYAKIDRHYRPTRSESETPNAMRLSMTLSRRSDADRSAEIFSSSTQQGQLLFAERYLGCLFSRGYRL
jgi:hypothetical protein